MTPFSAIILNTYLTDLLRQRGIEVNPASALLIQKILLNSSTDESTAIQQLKYRLTPVLSRSKEEQQKIYQVLDELAEKMVQQAAPVILRDTPPLQPAPEGKMKDKLVSFLKANWVPVAIVLLAAIAAAIFYANATSTKDGPLFEVYIPPELVAGRQENFSAVLSDTNDRGKYDIRWEFPDDTMRNTWNVPITFDTAGTYRVRVLLLRQNHVADSFITQANVNCEPVPDVMIREKVNPVSAAVGNNNQSAAKQPVNKRVAIAQTSSDRRIRKQYEPVFINPSPDSSRYSYTWYVNNQQEGRSKTFSYIKSAGEYNTIRLVVGCRNIHCSKDSLEDTHRENKTVAVNYTAGKSIPAAAYAWIGSNILYSIFYLLAIPAAFAAIVYYFRKKKIFRPSPRGKWTDTEPHSVEFARHDHLIAPETGLRILAHVLRKRQSTLSNRMDLHATIKSSIRSGGMPQLVFENSSTASEYLVFIDREHHNSHLTHLYEYLCTYLQSQQVNLIIYEYYKQPLLLSSSSLQHQLVTIDRVAALFPDSTLILFGHPAHFTSPRKNVLKDWTVEKLRQWKKKIFVTGYAVNDWDKKEHLLREAGFFVVPADIASLQLIESYLFGTHADHPSFFPPRTYPSRFLQLQTAADLRAYCGNQQHLFQWICALAIYPAVDWQVTLIIGQALEKYFSESMKEEKLLTYTHLLKIARIPWMQSGEWSDALKADLLTHLDNEIELVARSALSKETQKLLHSIPDDSVAKKELSAYHQLNTFIIDAGHQRHASINQVFDVKEILQTDQVDAAHRIYLHNALNTPLTRKDSPVTVNSSAYFRDQLRKPRKWLLTEALVVMLVLAATLYLLSSALDANWMQWRRHLPVSKTFVIQDRMDGEQALYASFFMGNRANSFAFTKDTQVVIDNILPIDSVTKIFYRISSDSMSAGEYDSTDLSTGTDTLVITEPVYTRVYFVVYDNTLLAQADAVEQELPENFQVSRKMERHSDTGVAIYFSDTIYQPQANQLQRLMLSVLNRGSRVLLLPENRRTNNEEGIHVYFPQNLQPVADTPRVVPVNSNNIRRPATWYSQQGARLYNEARYRESIRYYDSSIQLNPKDPLAYYNRALNYEQLREYPAARKDYQQAISMNANDALSTFRLAEIAFTLQEYQQAVSLYTRVIQINSPYITQTNNQAYFKRGDAYRFLGNDTEACNDYAYASQRGIEAAKQAEERYCRANQVQQQPVQQQPVQRDTQPAQQQPQQQQQSQQPPGDGDIILWIERSTSTADIRERLAKEGKNVVVQQQAREGIVYLETQKTPVTGLVYVVGESDYEDKEVADFVTMARKFTNSPVLIYYNRYKGKITTQALTKEFRNVQIVRNEKEFEYRLLQLSDNAPKKY